MVLKRVLLAYARWNKSVGYCQGFNVIAALILEVMERMEDDALKVLNQIQIQQFDLLYFFLNAKMKVCVLILSPHINANILQSVR